MCDTVLAATTSSLIDVLDPQRAGLAKPPRLRAEPVPPDNWIVHPAIVVRVRLHP
jgi:hypothetical protein